MTKNISERIISLCGIIPSKMRQLPEEEFCTKPSPVRWSKKEILGHLIDSATNNLQRFIRGQYEDSPVIFYDQDTWVELQNYQSERSEDMINLWEGYNRHLAYVISNIPEQSLQKTCRGKDGKLLSLSFLIEDYLEHLEHHLKQIVEY